MLGIDPGEWRRTLKAMVAKLDPDAAVLIGRGDPTGHHPLRLTLDGCRETVRLYDDQVVALVGDEATRAAIQKELKDALALLRLKAQIIRALQQAHPARRVTIVGPLACADGAIGVEIKGGSGLPARAARAATYTEALELLHQHVLKACPGPRP